MKEITVKSSISRKKWLCLLALSLPTLLISLDTSVLYLAFPFLVDDLHANSVEQLWIMDIYGFMLAGFLVPMGLIGDKIGHKKLLMVGAVCFGLSSTLGAFSQTVTALLIARSLMGISGATLMPSILALIRIIFIDDRERGTAIAIWMCCLMSGMVIGPLIGGYILEHFSWGSVFLLGMPAMLCLLIFGHVLLPSDNNLENKKIDVLSLLFSLSAILSFVFGITEFARYGVRYINMFSIFLGLLSGYIFYRRQLRLTIPLIDVRLFTNNLPAITLTLMFSTAVIMGGLAFFVVQYLQAVQSFPPLKTGTFMIPQAIGMIVGTLVVGKLAHFFKGFALISSGFFCAFAGVILMIIGVHLNLSLVVLGLAIATFGVAPILILGTNIIIGSTPSSKAGAAASLAETANQLGVAMGVAILGTLGAIAYRHSFVNLSRNLQSSEIISKSAKSIFDAISVTSKDQEGMQILVAAKQAFSNSLQSISILGAIVFLVLAIISLKVWRNYIHIK